MAVNLPEPSGLLAVPGVRLASGAAAIKAADRDDLALLEFAEGTAVAGVFTQSSFRAPPVVIAEARIREGQVRALLINSGNANAATGEPGREDALTLCRRVAEKLEMPEASVAPFSTGVIGERLPVDAMLPVIDGLPDSLSGDGWLEAGRAIMTTDTIPKVCSARAEIDGQPVTVSGMAKGSGMIRPDMATMLAFLATDATVSRDCLQALLTELCAETFNAISVDGDTSTNDAFVLAATGASAMAPIDDPRSPAAQALKAALAPVALALAQAIVRDGEGATKFVTIRVSGGRTVAECREVAFTVAHSPLVKTALFASDPNWGRLAMAIGRADVPGLDPTGVSVRFDDVAVMTSGLVDSGYTEAAGASVLAQDEFTLAIDLQRGDALAEVWTSDLSYEYVRINAEYRT